MKRSSSPLPSCSHQSKRQTISRSITIEFGSSIENLFCNFKHATKCESDLHFLTIHNVPSIAKSFDLLQQERFKSQICSFTKLVGINLRVNEVVDENLNDGPHFYDFEVGKRIFVAFQSTIGGHESKTFWKDPTCGQDYSLFIDDDEAGFIAAFFHEFLIDEIKNGRNGLIRKGSIRRPIRLYEIGNVKGRNLLHLAIYHARSDVVKSLLKHEFDPDDEIDFAWTVFLESKNSESSEVVLHLLNANSRFPKDFDYEKASKDVQVFVDYCERLHNCLDVIGATEDDEFVELTEKLELRPELMYFYNRYNQSLLAHAIKANKFELFVNLEKGLNTGSHEDLEHLYTNLDRSQRYDLGFTRQDSAVIYPNSHLFALKSMTKIGSNDQFHYKHWKFIDEAYKFVNSIDYCCKILKLAAKYKKLKIFFDFKHDTIYYMDPPNFEPRGKTYGIFNYNYKLKKCTIFIGAKYLTDDVKKFEVFKVLAHELCHLAVHMAFFQPGSEPYPLGESQIRSEYKKVVQHCKNNEDSEEIIKNIFKSYQKIDHESELIVTVPEMLIKYHNNQEKLDNLKSIFHKLFEFTELVVEPEIDKTLTLLDVLEDESRSINFADLTASMQAKILNTKILFQGVETTLLQLIQDDEDIGRELTDKDIRMMLFDGEVLSFGDTCESSLRHSFVERKFSRRFCDNTQHTTESAISDERNLSVDEISNKARTSKIFILADHAGTGKSTFFKHLTLKLKKDNPEFWISFINLRKHMSLFEEISSNDEKLSVYNIPTILFKMINRNSQLEFKIFTKLYSKNRVILLFDGLDEICPKYTNLMLKIISIIKADESKVELWISTRSHYAKKLETTLNVQSYKFEPYSFQEILDHFRSVVLAANLSADQKINILLQECVNSLKLIHSTSGVMTLMMVEMMTEIWVDNEVRSQFYTSFELYAAIIEKQRKKIGDKIPIEEHDRDSRVTVWDIHRILALIYLFGDNYKDLIGFKLEELSIMKRWKKDKKNWTSDMIQRYGFVVVDLIDVEGSIDFSHRSFAEFFVAQFIINSISEDSDIMNNEELDWIFQLLDFCFDVVFQHSEIHSFIKGYIAITDTDFVFHEFIRNKILKNISNAYFELTESKSAKLLVKYIKKYSLVLKNDKELTSKLWKHNDSSNIFEEILSNAPGIDIDLYNVVQSCFGLNWHEKFNRTDVELIRHEDIPELNVMFKYQLEYAENFYKFCHLLDKNFKTSYKIKFFKNVLEDKIMNEITNQKELVPKIRNVLGKEKFAEMIIVDMNFNYFTLKSNALKTALAIFDEDSHNHQSFLQISSTSNEDQSLSLIVAASFSDIFLHVIDFYKKYVPNLKDLKEAIMSSSAYDIICPVQHSTYSHYKDLIQNIFGNDTAELAGKIEAFLNTLDGKMDFKLEKLEDLKDFLAYIFIGDSTRVAKSLETVISKTWTQDINVNGTTDYCDLKYPAKPINSSKRIHALLQVLNDHSDLDPQDYLLSRLKLNEN